MSISKKPVAVTNSESLSEQEVQQIINRGGSVAQSEIREDDLKRLQLRLYASMVAEIDEACAQRPKRYRLSRHSWIVEAIEEKLIKERQSEA